MLANDFINIFLPVLSHWVIWLSFFVVAIIVLLLYAYPYIKKTREFRRYHIGIPMVSIVSLYIFAKMLEGVIYQGAILKVDALVNSVIYASWITSVAMFITNFGGNIIITILFIIALAFLVFKKRWRYAIISTAAILGALVLQLSIKSFVHRARPENLLETGFSFPSGHSIMAIIFVSLLIYSFKDDFKNKIIKYVLIVISISFFLSVGASRLVLHVHWFSDVIAGMSISLFWFMLVILIERAIPGLIPAVKVETKEAKPIVPKEVVKTAKAIVPAVVKKQG